MVERGEFFRLFSGSLLQFLIVDVRFISMHVTIDD